MASFDIFNGDADGLIAQHQYRLHLPADSTLTRISGVKRDIALASRANAQAHDRIQGFDLSWDTNADALESLLARGVHVQWFDHHRADRLPLHPSLSAHIDFAANVCTSLLVDQWIGGRFRRWTIAAAFGDNLITVACQLAQGAGLSAAETGLLRKLGVCLNYNAYGDDESDLWYRPLNLAKRLAGYANPFDFIHHEDVLDTLQRGYESDLEAARHYPCVHAEPGFAIVQLPDAAWARRVSGVWANELAEATPTRAHVVLTPNRFGTQTVSVRAPLASPRGADIVARKFGGGGRTGAAGIDQFNLDKLDTLICEMHTMFACQESSGGAASHAARVVSR